MIPRSDIYHPCASCGAEAEGELCRQCEAWAEVDRYVERATELLREAP